MRTPAGKECRFYYADFARGRSVQECRLVSRDGDSQRWTPAVCAHCPVPDILHANSSPELVLTLTIKAKFLGLGRQPKVTASCRRHRTLITDPYSGCDACNAERPGLDAFMKALEDADGD